MRKKYDLVVIGSGVAGTILPSSVEMRVWVLPNLHS